MSRSHRKTPRIGHTTQESEKAEKTQRHRQQRQAARRATHRGDEDIPPYEHHPKDWWFGKDGKWFFDPAKHPALLRK